MPGVVVPDALGPGAWHDVDALARTGEYWESLGPSTFVQQTPLVEGRAA